MRKEDEEDGFGHRHRLLPQNELDTPTIARRVPTVYERWDSFSVTNASSLEAKITYVKLNTQTPCPPRGAVPVNQGRCGRLFHSQRPDRLRLWMRLSQLCPWFQIRIAT